MIFLCVFLYHSIVFARPSSSENLGAQPNRSLALVLSSALLKGPHHLIGRTKGKSLDLVSKLLRILAQSLSDKGILIVHEVYYDSYMIPSLTSTLIFYMLKFLNLINLDMSPIIKEFQLGLEVNFMHTAELKRLLEQLGGKVRIVGKDPGIIPTFRRIMLLLKEQGSVTFSYELNNKGGLKK